MVSTLVPGPNAMSRYFFPGRDVRHSTGAAQGPGGNPFVRRCQATRALRQVWNIYPTGITGRSHAARSRRFVRKPFRFRIGWRRYFDNGYICITYSLLDRRAEVVVVLKAALPSASAIGRPPCGHRTSERPGMFRVRRGPALHVRGANLSFRPRCTRKCRLSSNVPVLRTQMPASSRVRNASGFGGSLRRAARQPAPRR